MKQKLLKTMLLLCALIVGGSSAWGDDVLYSETFGDNGSSNTAFASYSGYSATVAMFTGSGTVASHYTGSGKVGKNSVSVSDYDGASGLSAAWYTGAKDATADALIISGINISGYESLNLSFGMNMTNGASNTNTTTVSYKIDDGEFQSLSFTHPTSSGWSVKSGSISGTGSSLTIKFTMTTTGGFTTRYDDIKVTGTPVASSDPSSSAAFASTTPSIDLKDGNTYSQTPTTAAGYSGTISYEITDNTAGATINASTGEVTVSQEGSVTVKATAAAVPGSFSSSNASYILTVSDTRASAGLAWSAASASVTYDSDSNVFPTLTNTHSVSVTYSSSNTSAATINATTGIITLKDVTASTTIKATFAGDATYKPQEVTYTLNVTKAPFAVRDGVFDFVSAASEGEDYGSGVSTTSSSSEYVTVDKTWTAVNVTMVTSRVSGNGYRWWSSDGTLRFYNESSATFSVPSGYVITKIVTTGGTFNSSSPSGLSGATWTGASNTVELSATASKNIKTITVTYTTENQSVTLNTYGYATFASPYALDFSDDSEFSAWQITGVSGSAITFSQITGAVAAGTGVLLKGDASETISIPVAASGSVDVSGNLLDGITSATSVDANAYYGLSGNSFVKVNAGTVPAGKALLPASEVSAGVKAFKFVFEGEDDADGINAVNGEGFKFNGPIYNLAGQRINKLQKGINIVNGKKVLY